MIRVELWFFQRLLRELIKTMESCVLMRDSLTEKFSGIDEAGRIWWKCLKNTSNPSMLMSETSWHQYLQNILDELNQLIPYVLRDMKPEYMQLEQQLYVLLQKEAMSPNDFIAFQELELRQRMYQYEVVFSWCKGYPLPWVKTMRAYKGALWFKFLE